MIHEASFVFSTPDAPLIAASLMPESESEPVGRSCGRCMIRDDMTLTIEIRAEDLTAFRAAVNTWLRLVQIAEEMVQTTKKAGTTNK